jgi:hypothetical protein
MIHEMHLFVSGTHTLQRHFWFWLYSYFMWKLKWKEGVGNCISTGIHSPWVGCCLFLLTVAKILDRVSRLPSYIVFASNFASRLCAVTTPPWLYSFSHTWTVRSKYALKFRRFIKRSRCAWLRAVAYPAHNSNP